jgi:hypothetical protein
MKKYLRSYPNVSKAEILIFHFALSLLLDLDRPCLICKMRRPELELHPAFESPGEYAAGSVARVLTLLL